jgi:N-carbamoyl-L-amino-acid hydrolase
MIKINPQRLMSDLMELATITEPDTPGWTRRFPSAAYQRGRQWVRAKMEAEGLTTRLDAAGNLFGRREGKENLPTLMSGSHTDTVMGAGRYDGMLGVLGALESARAIREAGIQLRHPFTVADYLSEEATDYGIACMGSMIAVTTDFRREWLDRKVHDKTLREAIAEMGGTPDHMPSPLLKRGDIAAHFELHIEQGPVLEARHSRIAAVSGIVGIHRAVFELNGKSNHAGATPMDLRTQ